MAVVTSHAVNDSNCNPAFISGLSAYMEPAYVDNLATKDLCFDDCRDGNNELGATLFTRSPSTYCFKPPPGLCEIGETLKATASFQFPSSGPYDKPENAMYCNLSKSNRKRRTKRRAVLLIATQLNELQSEDPDKVLIVRKINRLGFDSADILKTHFEQFGPVEKVRLSNAHTKELGTSRRVRLRPSGIAFVLFKSSETAAEVLAEGEMQVIRGLEVYVRRFERRELDEGSPEVDEVEEMEMDEFEDTASAGTRSTRASTSDSLDVDGEECQK